MASPQFAGCERSWQSFEKLLYAPAGPPFPAGADKLFQMNTSAFCNTIRVVKCFLFCTAVHKNIPTCVEVSYNQLDINATGEKSLSMDL
jgi:hypothetical protein